MGSSTEGGKNEACQLNDFLELTDDEAVGIKPRRILKMQPKYSPYNFISPLRNIAI